LEQGKDYRIGEEALHGGDRGWIAPGLKTHAGIPIPFKGWDESMLARQRDN
jgi:hypothetical protein